MAEVLKVSLQDELEKAKECLKDVDENIKKLTGRDPNDIRPGIRRVSVGGPGDVGNRGRERLLPFGGGNTFGRRESSGLEGPPATKRRATAGAFSRLGPRVDARRSRDESGDEDDLPRKLTVQSSIVATPKEVKTRKDTLDEQKNDTRGLARNRRMFGLLLGTLQRFKEDEHKKQDKEQKRMKIEKKLEEAAEKEREDLKKERQELFVERRRRQGDLRRLEQKMELVKQQEEWEAHYRQLLGCIQTKTKLPIFYLPAKHNAVTLERLKTSRKRVEEMIAARRAQTEEELRDMDLKRMMLEVTEPAEGEEETMIQEEEPIPILEGGEGLVRLEEAEEGKENNPEGTGNNGEESQPLSSTEVTMPISIVEGEANVSNETAVTTVVAVKVETDNTIAAVQGESDIPEQLVNATMAEEESNKATAGAEHFYANEQNLLTEKEFEPIYD